MKAWYKCSISLQYHNESNFLNKFLNLSELYRFLNFYFKLQTQPSKPVSDEFSNVDLESMTEEEDPPSFKAARKKDKERLQRLEQTGVLENGNF